MVGFTEQRNKFNEHYLWQAEAEDEDAAREIMANDPAIKGSVLAAQLFPFRIALMGNPAK